MNTLHDLKNDCLLWSRDTNESKNSKIYTEERKEVRQNQMQECCQSLAQRRKQLK